MDDPVEKPAPQPAQADNVYTWAPPATPPYGIERGAPPPNLDHPWEFYPNIDWVMRYGGRNSPFWPGSQAAPPPSAAQAHPALQVPANNAPAPQQYASLPTAPPIISAYQPTAPQVVGPAMTPEERAAATGAPMPAGRKP